MSERLGFRASDRVVILSGDLLGSCHAANIGVYEAMRMGMVTSSSLMVPCPWARHAAAAYRGESVIVGVNRYCTKEEQPIATLRIDRSAESRQVDKLRELRANRR